MASSTRDAFLSLLDQLYGFFQGHEGGVVTMAMGVDPADDRSLALLQRVSYDVIVCTIFSDDVITCII